MHHLKPKEIWRTLSEPNNADRLKRIYVELTDDDLTSTIDQAGMETLLSQLPAHYIAEPNMVGDRESLTRVPKRRIKDDISYFAMAIQLARLQQALLHTCDGQRFFPGKADLGINPGCRVFEELIEIEDLSRAYELFTYQKHSDSYKPKTEGGEFWNSKDVLAQKPYFYPLNLAWAHYVAKLDVGNSNASVLAESSDTIDNQTSSMRTPIGLELPVAIQDVSENIGGVGTRGRPSRSAHLNNEDHQTSCKAQGRIEDEIAKARQKQKDTKSKMSSIKSARRYDQSKLKGWKEKVENLKLALKDHDDELEVLSLEDKETANELKKLENEAKLLLSDFDLSALKRKRDELQQEEQRIKKQKQALLEED